LAMIEEVFTNIFKPFFPKIFCGFIGTDLFMCLVRVGVRSCTFGSPHTPFKRELLRVVVVVVVEEVFTKHLYHKFIFIKSILYVIKFIKLYFLKILK